MLSFLAQTRGYTEYAQKHNARMQKIFALALSIICFLLLVDNEVPVFPLHFEETLTYYNISLIFCGVFLFNWFVLKICDYFPNAKIFSIWWSIAAVLVFIHTLSFLELLNGNGLTTLALGTIMLAVLVSSNYFTITSLLIGNNVYLYIRVSQLPEVDLSVYKMLWFGLTMLAILIFITIEKQRRKVFGTQQLLSEKIDELNNAIEVKSTFFKHMSHELRTPLNSLLLLSQNLLTNSNKNLTDQQVKHVDVIHSSGSELLRMVDGLLDLAKVDANKISVCNDEISFQNLSEHIYNVFQPLMDAANLDFTITIDDKLPNTFVSDQQYLLQIIKNLLSNALKFTENGEISVDIVQHIPPDNNEEQIKISVTDTGIGIDENMQQKVFDEFSQADRNISRKYGGTGLGLTISKKLAILLGGDITLYSSLTNGSTFNLFLPLITTSSIDYTNEIDEIEDMIITPASTLRANKKTRLKDCERALEGKTILLVDDDTRNLFSLSEVLNKYGIRSIIAESGIQALNLLKDHKEIDLILMDMMMPGMDGEDAISRIRFTARGEHLPIISLTANAMPKHRQRCLDAGANDYLTKPIDIETLLSKMSVWL